MTQSLKRTSEAAGAKAKRFLRLDIICKFSEVSRPAKQGPGTPRASGPTLSFASESTGATNFATKVGLVTAQYLVEERGEIAELLRILAAKPEAPDVRL